MYPPFCKQRFRRAYRNHPVCAPICLFTLCPQNNFFMLPTIWMILQIIVNDQSECHDLDQTPRIEGFKGNHGDEVLMSGISVIFSAPEAKAQVHYCEHTSFVHTSSLTFHILDFFSETAERNSMKLERKQDLNILFQVSVFQANWKNKMAAMASDWLTLFLPLL